MGVVMVAVARGEGGAGGGSRRRVRHSPGAASDSPQPIN